MLTEAFSYSLNNGVWAKLSNFDVFSATNLRGSEEGENAVMMLTRYGELSLFPNLTATESSAILISKKFHIPTEGGARRIFRLKKIRAVYEETAFIGIVLRIYNNRFPIGYLDTGVTLKGSGRWSAIPGGYKGDYFDIRVINASMIQDIEVEATILS